MTHWPKAGKPDLELFVVFCPTGGINPKNYQSFLKLPNVACVGGSWIAPAQRVREGHWEEITRLAAEVTGKAI